MTAILTGQRREAAAYDAAVITADDPRARDSARVVPKGAEIIKFGNVALGYVATPQKKKGLPVECWPIFERRREIHQLVQGRRRDGVIDEVQAASWCLVLANLAACMAQHVPDAPRDIEQGIDQLCDWIGLPRIDRRWIEPVKRDVTIAARVWNQYRLFSPDEVGALLHVTKDERTDYKLLKIGSMDETNVERRQRLDRERKRRKRGTKMTLKQEAEALGVSVSTLKRRKASQHG